MYWLKTRTIKKKTKPTNKSHLLAHDSASQQFGLSSAERSSGLCWAHWDICGPPLHMLYRSCICPLPWGPLSGTLAERMIVALHGLSSPHQLIQASSGGGSSLPTERSRVHRPGGPGQSLLSVPCATCYWPRQIKGHVGRCRSPGRGRGGGLITSTVPLRKTQRSSPLLVSCQAGSRWLSVRKKSNYITLQKWNEAVRDWVVFLQKSHIQVLICSTLQNVTVFGDWIIKIKVRWGHKGAALIYRDWCPWKKRERHQGYLCTERRLCEDTGRRRPPSSHGGWPWEKPSLLTPWSWTSSLQTMSPTRLW